MSTISAKKMVQVRGTGLELSECLHCKCSDNRLGASGGAFAARGNAIESNNAKYAVFMRWNRVCGGVDLGADEIASGQKIGGGECDGGKSTGCGVEFRGR